MFEKTINHNLLHFLEANKTLDPYQYGFPEGWSTVDILTHVEANIRDTLTHKQFFLPVFLDIEEGYGTTWRYDIIRGLSGMGMRGDMLRIIESLLSHRTFRVRIGNARSRSFRQETGVPLGDVLSSVIL